VLITPASDSAEYPKNVSVLKKIVERNTKLNVKLAPGGYAVRFVPVK